MTTACKRRSPGEGGAVSYQTKAGERWCWKAMITKADGTRKAVAGPRGFLTKKAALAAMREAQGASEKGAFVDPSKQPTGEYLDEWAAGLRLEPSTMASYRKNIRLHLRRHIGSVPLASLTTARIDALYRELEASGRRDHREGEGLSARTVRYVAMILSSALGAAVKSHRLARNPAADASPPTAKQAKSPEMHPWTAGQLAAFLGWSGKYSRHHFAWHLLAMSGMRRSELLALRWRDIDLDAGTVSVRRSAGVVRVKGQGATIVEGPTKGGTSRTVDLDPATVALGRAHKRERGSRSLALAAPDALVFGDAEGRHLHPERFSRTFQETLTGAARSCRTCQPQGFMISGTRTRRSCCRRARRSRRSACGSGTPAPWSP